VSIFSADPYPLLFYQDAFYSKVFLTFREILMNNTKTRFGLYPGCVVRTLHQRTFLFSAPVAAPVAPSAAVVPDYYY
jgi:hypothetical protein